MTRDELIACALGSPGAFEDYPFGDDLLTAKVGGRVFAWIPLDDAGWLGRGPRVAVKLPPDVLAELRDRYPADVAEARPLDQRYWLRISAGGTIPDDEVADLLEMSHHEVIARLPRRLRPI